MIWLNSSLVLSLGECNTLVQEGESIGQIQILYNVWVREMPMLINSGHTIPVKSCPIESYSKQVIKKLSAVVINTSNCC